MPSIELPAEPTLSPESTFEAIPSSTVDAWQPSAATSEDATEPVRESDAAVNSKPKRRAWYWRWMDNRIALLAILFLVTGAFGLPLLYHSRAFSTRMKWTIGIANVVYTVVSCYWAYLEIAKSVAIIQAVLA